MESDAKEMSARDLRALSSYLRKDAEDGILPRDSVSVCDIVDTSALTLGSQHVRAKLVVGPSSIKIKRPRRGTEGTQQSVQTLRVSNIEVPAVAVIPEILTPLPAPPLPDRLFEAVGQQISNQQQSVHNLQSNWRQVRSSKQVPCQTFTKVHLKESCVERIPSSSLGYVLQETASGDENQMLCDDILAQPSFRIEDDSLFGEEYFWDYRDFEDNFQLTKPPGPHPIQQEIIEEDQAHDEPAAGGDQGTPIYPGASITMLESLTSILSFVQSEQISGVGLGRLLSLIDLHLPQPNNFYKSSHAVSKMLETIDEPVLMHYFCSVCYKNRVGLSDLCDSCTDPSRYVHYFLTFSLAAQLSRFLIRPEFVQNLQHKLTRNKQNPDNIEDISLVKSQRDV
ncbi:LOW QUALITY PROTEIN: Acetate kinase [Frankliniella fusca]|uniref:Acetate kinase n=1 Tax=Frankliniella fusca TaxID=407009 RepID=A0AAE1GWH5_9NEOP|nr:LOW QUALITY PROTEIN: Acetate kinase [Frankliniella fusca]